MLGDHPLSKIRRDLRLTNREFADLLGCSRALLLHCQSGLTRSIPPSLLRLLREKGFDVNRLRDEHREFRRRRMKAPTDINSVWEKAPTATASGPSLLRVKTRYDINRIWARALGSDGQEEP